MHTTSQPIGVKRGRRSSIRSTTFPKLILSPTAIIILALVVVPLIFLIFTSFTNFNQRSLFTGEFDIIGFNQYANVVKDPEFYASLVRTFLYTIVLVAGSVLAGMAVAQMMTKLNTVMRYIVTLALIFAWAMPNVASALVWKWLFQPGYGVMDYLLTKLGLFGDVTNLAWSNNTTLAYISIWLLVVWQGVPYIAITLYAATTQVDSSLIEAAHLDGCGAIRTYWQVIVPSIKQSLMVITILSVIWDFNIFNQIWLFSEGGPDGSTSTLGIFTFRKAFVNFDIAQGASISVITSLILLIITSFYVRNLLKSGENL